MWGSPRFGGRARAQDGDDQRVFLSIVPHPRRLRTRPEVLHVAGVRLWDFDRVWRAARQAAGFPARLFHDYRRTAVRDLVRSGVSQSVAMRWTGHKTDAVFRRYNITTTEDIEHAAERLAVYRDNRAKTLMQRGADA